MVKNRVCFDTSTLSGWLLADFSCLRRGPWSVRACVVCVCDVTPLPALLFLKHVVPRARKLRCTPYLDVSWGVCRLEPGAFCGDLDVKLISAYAGYTLTVVLEYLVVELIEQGSLRTPGSWSPYTPADAVIHKKNIVIVLSFKLRGEAWEISKRWSNSKKEASST